jgi:lipopolysaccharide/colanic/teichoic acid biosynthesis glycosyltransferase
MSNFHNNCCGQEILEDDSSLVATPRRVPAWKRAFDITCVLATLIVWAPLGVMTAIFIKIVSPGPILFRQKRIGYMGKEFHCLKFRTMKPNADVGVHQKHLRQLITSDQPMKKLDGIGDARLIRGGSWLRALGLDELPQLINVLRGEMSLVGPRPCVAYEYEMDIPRFSRRCQTLPGLTGMWQVNGKNKTTFEEMMALDLAYVERQSLFLDCKIIACTAPAILVQAWDLRSARKKAARAKAQNTDTEPGSVPETMMQSASLPQMEET